MNKKIKTALNLLWMILFISYPLGAEDYFLVINSSGRPTEKPRFIGAFEHLSFERKQDLIAKGSPRYPIPRYNFHPRRSLHSGDRHHTFQVEENERVYKVPGTLVYGSPESRCLIYVEDSSKRKNSSEWNMIGNFFDHRISPQMNRVFGSPGDIDKNGKTIIFYYSFLDEDLLGYFNSGDLESSEEWMSSNEMELLYMNIDYGSPGSRDMMETLPHEYLHLICCSERRARGFSEMDVWLEEGVADCATELVMKKPFQENLEILRDESYFKWSETGLCSWGEEDKDYALSYLFLQYLKIQAGTNEIFKEIIQHPSGTAAGLADVMRTYVPLFASFPEILKSFYLALIFHNDEGLYGFKSMNHIYDVHASEASADFNGYLYPGGAVYLPLPEEEIVQTKAPSKNIILIDSREYR